MGEVAIGRGNRLKVQTRKRRNSEFGTKRRGLFLEHLAATCNVTAAARKAGVALSTPYMARMRDPEFRAQWSAAIEQGYARLEAALMRRSIAAAERRIARGAGAPDDVDPVDPTIGLHLLRLHRHGLERRAGDVLPRRSNIEAARARLEGKMRTLGILARGDAEPPDATGRDPTGEG